MLTVSYADQSGGVTLSRPVACGRRGGVGLDPLWRHQGHDPGGHSGAARVHPAVAAVLAVALADRAAAEHTGPGAGRRRGAGPIRAAAVESRTRTAPPRGRALD